jgi:hypothetical protein
MRLSTFMSTVWHTTCAVEVTIGGVALLLSLFAWKMLKARLIGPPPGPSSLDRRQLRQSTAPSLDQRRQSITPSLDRRRRASMSAPLAMPAPVPMPVLLKKTSSAINRAAASERIQQARANCFGGVAQSFDGLEAEMESISAPRAWHDPLFPHSEESMFVGGVVPKDWLRDGERGRVLTNVRLSWAGPRAIIIDTLTFEMSAYRHGVVPTAPRRPPHYQKGPRHLLLPLPLVRAPS